MAKANAISRWPVKAENPPRLDSYQWGLTMALGVLFILMAVLQLIGFNDFKAALDKMGIASAAVWGTVLIIIELWAAAGFFKLRLSRLFRIFSSVCAVLAGGFWFYESIRLVASDMTSANTMGFFGRFLNQSPGWWTVIEATIFLLWTLWAVSLTRVSDTK